ncbi:hypothetical protein EGI26_12830 [Lacihabitans sp. CCS-44]|uniref:hypothetical protein n=1 Tax=Lacihabitans sp. CCS-44 TaxID=2487331 RepID=UPI0020CD7D9D|nr:hypothetical protein [Lacihabitans sp. CCS-44]MCP9756039.1 hypothetical protein [Lacihabitans sp. CCS-44]
MLQADEFQKPATSQILVRQNQSKKKQKVSNNTIAELTYTDPEMSNRTKDLIHKNLSSIELIELAFLLREYIAIPICIPFAIKQLQKQGLKLALMFKDDNSAAQRELVRELILLSRGCWDANPIYFYSFYNIIKEQISYLNLPKVIIEDFLAYQPSSLEWNSEKINKYYSYMNDTYIGVKCGYSMIVSLKRALLNGNAIRYSDGKNEFEINNLEDFNTIILNNLNCSDELKGLLNKEKPIID